MVLSTQNFPLIAAEPKTATYLPRLLDLLNKYLPTKSIPNPDFQDCKYYLNRVADAARDMSGIYGDAFRAAYHADLDFMSAVHCAGKVKKAAKKGFNNRVWLDVCAEIIKLTEAVESLKTGIVKRQPRSEEERAEDYVPPMPTTAAAILTNGILKEMTDPLVAKYEARLFADFCFEVLHRMANPRKRGDRYTPSIADALMSKVGENWDSFDGNYRSLRDDWKDILSAKAKADADFAQRMFLYKNVLKLATIIERKANFAGHQIVYGEVGNGGFWGEIRFEFGDGSSFNVKNKVVGKYSVHGRAFLQFPTTFHVAILPGGAKMAKSSEERMIEVFAAAKEEKK